MAALGLRRSAVRSRAVSSREPLERDALRGDLLAQVLDLALGREDAARLGLAAAGHHVLAAEDVAVDGRHRERPAAPTRRGGLEGLGNQRIAHRRLDGRRDTDRRRGPRRSAHACRPLPRTPPCRSPPPAASPAGASDDEAAAAGVFLRAPA